MASAKNVKNENGATVEMTAAPVGDLTRRMNRPAGRRRHTTSFLPTGTS